MKKTKKIIKIVDIAEYKNLEQFLEKKALEGWMLVEIKRNTYIFEMIEPKELAFNVSLLYNASPFDYPDGEKEKDYRELCEEIGWTFCTSNKLFQIFYKDKDLDIVAVHTDPEEEYRIIKSTLIKTNGIPMAWLLLSLLMGIVNILRFDYEDLLSNSALFSVTWPLIMAIIWLAIVIPPLLWIVKNKANIKNGNKLKYLNNHQILIKNSIIGTLFAFYTVSLLFAFSDLTLKPAFLLFMVILILVPAGIAILTIKRFRSVKRSRKENIIFFMIVIVITTIVSTSAGTLFLVSGFLRPYGIAEEKELGKSDFQVLELRDFGMNEIPSRSRLRENSSLFSPLNVEYYESLGRHLEENEIGSVRTTYIETINQKISDYIFNSFMENEYRRNDELVAEYLEYGEESQAEEVKDDITEIVNHLWNVDNGYYLNDNYSRIIIQKKEKIYILSSDVDFSDTEIIEICKSKLGL